MPPQLGGFLYDTIFYVNCLPRLHKEVFTDEAHVRREMEDTASNALASWGQYTGRNRDAVADYAVACWKAICAKREENEA